MHVAHYGKEDFWFQHEVNLVTYTDVLLNHQQFATFVHTDIKFASAPGLWLFVLNDDGIVGVSTGSRNCKIYKKLNSYGLDLCSVS